MKLENVLTDGAGRCTSRLYFRSPKIRIQCCNSDTILSCIVHVHFDGIDFVSPLDIFGLYSGHKALFYEICSLHNIDRKTRSLLLKIMDKYNPDRPGIIFLDDKYLHKAIDDEEFRSSSELLQELQQKWFQE